MTLCQSLVTDNDLFIATRLHKSHAVSLKSYYVAFSMARIPNKIIPLIKENKSMAGKDYCYKSTLASQYEIKNGYRSQLEMLKSDFDSALSALRDAKAHKQLVPAATSIKNSCFYLPY